MTSISTLHNIATRLRIDSVRSTSQAGSGHPSTCLSAAEIMAVLFFAEMRYDPRAPDNPDNDRFVLSKGHAAPILYAAWAEAGLFPREELMQLREITSDLEGHPTPRLNFVDVATGSLGQGICAAVGIALNARRIGSDYRTYVLIGDGESSEGSVWEAAQMAQYHKLDSLCGITDVNGWGQSAPTPWGRDTSALAARWRAFGWESLEVDGHDLKALVGAFERARTTKGRPTMILARTVKGQGVKAFMEGNWHGKPLKAGDDTAKAVAELEEQFVADGAALTPQPPAARARTDRQPRTGNVDTMPPPAYKVGDSVATREAYGAALAAHGVIDDRVVAHDADGKNSTYSEKFEKEFPDRVFQSHAGVSLGEDGPSQMALEDLAMMRAVPNCTVLYPCDGVSAERLVALAAYTRGPAYIRTTRPKTPVLYSSDERFEVGGSKILRESSEDAVTVVAAGITVHEALKAHDRLAREGVRIRVIDAYSVQPIDARTLVRCGRATRNTILTVEDHYAHGGLGDAVSGAVSPDGIVVHRLAVREIPRSGRSDELLDRFGISARAIADVVRRLAGVQTA
jgi:transketolase